MSLPPKLWFQWQRIKKAFASSQGSGENAPASSVRMCPHCRALIDRDARTCPLCGEATGPTRARGAGSPGRIMGVIPIPTTASSVMVAICLALYAIEWYMTQNSASTQMGGALSMGDISGEVLRHLGSKSPDILIYHQWWRLVTAMFLHVGLLHIGMNLWCLVDLGPEVESLFNTTKFIVLYLVTGVVGFMLSLWWSPFQASAGASGAIMGLIGILIGASFHHGTMGKDYRRQLWRWVIYIAIFGIFFSVDNAAHLGGLLSGLVLGYVVPEGEPKTRPSENLWNALAILSALIITASFALMALQLGQPLQPL